MKESINGIISHLEKAARIAASIDPDPTSWNMWTTYFIECLEERAENLQMNPDDMLKDLEAIIAERRQQGRW